MAKYQLGGVSLSSSTNPEQLAKTVEGVLMGASGLIIYLIGSLFDIQVSVETYAQVVGLVGTGIGLAVALFGVLRKILVKVSEVKS